MMSTCEGAIRSADLRLCGLWPDPESFVIDADVGEVNGRPVGTRR